MNCSILILSCDKYDDVWDMFFKLKDKYWKDCPFDIYMTTETKKCKHCETINVDTPIWTKRIRESLKQIPTKYVIVVCEDYFFRNYVDEKRVFEALNIIKNDKNIATLNFELSWDEKDVNSEYEGWALRQNQSKYMLSSQAGMWNKNILIELLNGNFDPWQWERQIIDSKYKFYTNKDKLIIDYGKYGFHSKFSIVGGKWCKEIVPFFEKEGIKIDYSKRGFYD